MSPETPDRPDSRFVSTTGPARRRKRPKRRNWLAAVGIAFAILTCAAAAAGVVYLVLAEPPADSAVNADAGLNGTNSGDGLDSEPSTEPASEGAPQAEITPSSMDFGHLSESENVSRVMTIRNLGTSTLVISRIVSN